MRPVWATAARLAEARQHYSSCALCEHRCGVNRLAGEKGPCKAGPTARVFRHRIECGEESELVPSQLFYLSGCDLRCVFCIAEKNAFDPGRGQALTPEYFEEAVAWGQERGVRTVQWVGGEPTIHVPAILDAMSTCSRLPPIVWKSDFHGTKEAFALLSGVADIYLADFKFGNDACARRLAGISNYISIVTRNLELAANQGDLIVRHLLLPGHLECCFRPLVYWMHDHLPRAKFSLRDGYLPRWQARRHEEMARPLQLDEARRANDIARDAGLNLIY
jgi:putative pyruvate formate lyase activating enzyme